jgi:hypothetical protein
LLLLVATTAQVFSATATVMTSSLSEMMAAFCELPAKANETEASAAANTMFLNMGYSINLGEQ